MAEITISAEPPKPISVELVGVEYKVRPVKTSLGIAMSQRFNSTKEEDLEGLQKNLTSVITTMFGKTDAKKIQGRLNDPDDLLDLDHVFQLMRALSEKSSGNPTT